MRNLIAWKKYESNKRDLKIDARAKKVIIYNTWKKEGNSAKKNEELSR